MQRITSCQTCEQNVILLKYPRVILTWLYIMCSIILLGFSADGDTVSRKLGGSESDHSDSFCRQSLI